MMKKPEKSFSGFSGFSYAIRILQQTRQMCTAAVDAQSALLFLQDNIDVAICI